MKHSPELKRHQRFRRITPWNAPRVPAKDRHVSEKQRRLTEWLHVQHNQREKKMKKIKLQLRGKSPRSWGIRAKQTAEKRDEILRDFVEDGRICPTNPAEFFFRQLLCNVKRQRAWKRRLIKWSKKMNIFSTILNTENADTNICNSILFN